MNNVGHTKLDVWCCKFQDHDFVYKRKKSRDMEVSDEVTKDQSKTHTTTRLYNKH
jgi:hypothetical protein